MTTQTEARELAQRFGTRMCDENGDTHGEELYCLGLDDIVEMVKTLAQQSNEQSKCNHTKTITRADIDGNQIETTCGECGERVAQQSNEQVDESVAHCEAGPEYCWKCNEEMKPTYGSEEIRKLREVNKRLSDHIPDVKKMVEALREIGDFAHDKSTGPTVPDALWEIRSMAYDAMVEFRLMEEVAHPPVPTEQPKEPEQPAQQEPDDALFWHRVRVHLANRNFYSHKEFCEKLEALMHETQPKQEPVAFIDMREWPPIRWRDGMVRADVSFFDGQGLFFAPPQRKPWVSLTPEKIEEINCLNILWDDGERGEIVNVKEFVEAVEAKLRELNEAPQRKPLTDEQMNQIWFEQNKTHGSVIWRFARAIEAAHGIKE